MKIVFGLEIIRDFRNFVRDFVWKNHSIAIKMMRKSLNYDQKANSLGFSWFQALFREIRDRVIFPYMGKNKNNRYKIFPTIPDSTQMYVF
jgi:hypothetical protein